MYELHQVGENTFYIDCPAKMGVYRVAPEEAVLIDSGNDKEAGKKVLKIFDAQGWRLKAVYNTHSNADHIGGNRLLADRTGCAVYGTEIENAFTRDPLLEPSFLFGGYPPRELRGKFLVAQPSSPRPLTPEALPAGMTMFPLPGHFFGMVGFATDDGVCFLADCLSGENILEKYHVSFIYDVAAYLETLDRVEQMQARLFVPAHAAATADIRPTVHANRAKVQEVAARITELCSAPQTFEQVLQQLFKSYGLAMDFAQYVLVGSTVKSYLAWLHDTGRLEARFEDSRLLWQAV